MQVFIKMLEENRFCVECEAVVSVGAREMVEERRLRKVESYKLAVILDIWEYLI